MHPTEFEHVVQMVRHHTECLQKYTAMLHRYKPVSVDIKVLENYEDGQIITGQPYVQPEEFYIDTLGRTESTEQPTEQPTEQHTKKPVEPLVTLTRKRRHVALRNDSPKRACVQHASSDAGEANTIHMYMRRSLGAYNWWSGTHGFLTVDGSQFHAHAYTNQIRRGQPQIGQRVSFDLWKNTQTQKYFAKNIYAI